MLMMFQGVTAIYQFRKLGMKVKCFEGAGDFGGTWYWNVSISESFSWLIQTRLNNI